MSQLTQQRNLEDDEDIKKYPPELNKIPLQLTQIQPVLKKTEDKETDKPTQRLPTISSFTLALRHRHLQLPYLQIQSLQPQTQSITQQQHYSSSDQWKRFGTLLLGICFFSFACYFYSIIMMSSTFLLCLFIVYLPAGKSKELVLQIGTAITMLSPLLGESIMERIRMTGHCLVILLKVWDYIVEHRDNPEKRNKTYSLKQVLFYFFHPMADLPADREASSQDVQITLFESIVKFFILGCFIMVGYFLPPLITEIFFIKSALGLVYFYLFIDAILQIDAVCVMWLSGWYIPPMFDYPFLSQSPRDFWSRRWNMMVHRFVHKHFFIPMKKAGLPTVLPVICIGVFTSLLHEYLVIFSALSFESFGQMSLFFFIHVIASVIQVILFKVGFWKFFPVTYASLNITMHSLWFIITAPIFLKSFFSADITIIINEMLDKRIVDIIM